MDVGFDELILSIAARKVLEVLHDLSNAFNTFARFFNQLRQIRLDKFDIQRLTQILDFSGVRFWMRT